MNENRRQFTPELSVETLEEIVRNCQRNEQRLQELERRARHERKKAERLLRETYQAKQKRERQPPVEYFVPFDDEHHLHKPSSGKVVRFNLPEKDNEDKELVDLSRRCEDLLLRLRIHERESSVSDEYLSRDALDPQQSLPPDLQISKRKYQQLPEVNERLRQELINEMKRRNSLRAKIFRVRLRQHILMHGRTNIDQSLTMLDT